jgi:hypothetical protein
MASKEGSTYQNAIRFNNGTFINYEKGKKAFDNQIPGTYVSDAKSDVYVCTTSKSEKGEPIWGRINTVTMQPVGKYVLINTGESGTKPVTRGLGGKEVKYTLPSILKRTTLGRTYDKTVFGSFIFIVLSSNEVDKITSPPNGSTVSTINSRLGDSDYDLVKSILNAEKDNAEIYNFMRTDSNGRSGFGASAGKRVTVVVGRDGLGNPIYGERTFTSPSRVSSLIPPTPSPSGSTNPSSPSGGVGGPSAGGKGSGKGSSASPSSPSVNQTSPNYPTVQITFLADREIYSGQDTYSGYQDKPHIQQIITEFDSVRKTRQRIIRRHVFDIIPNTFEFSQLSSTWNEVERSGNYPMVDWAKYNLTKCSFRFLVASRRIDKIESSETIVNDGMDVSIDAELENIRAIAGSPHPVIFNNLNRFLTTSYRFPYLNNTRNIQWVIADLSINATRLTPNGRGIAAAEVSITLNEYPVIAKDIVPLPPLAPDNPVIKQCNPKPCKPVKLKERGLLTSTFGIAFGSGDSLSTPEAK